MHGQQTLKGNKLALAFPRLVAQQASGTFSSNSLVVRSCTPTAGRGGGSCKLGWQQAEGRSHPSVTMGYDKRAYANASRSTTGSKYLAGYLDI